MVTRHERVVLSASGNLPDFMVRAAAATELLDHNLEDLDGSSIRAQRSMQRADKSVAAFSKQSRAASADLNTFTGRLGLLGTAAAALGPALVPISAAAIPAIGALAAGMVGASAAAGTLLLAFNGVGDAVSAVSDYQLAPTAENLAKVQAAFEEIGPSGARFVMALREMQPILDDLQQASRDGIFPGFERGLDALVTRAPEVISFVEDISRRVGDMGGDIGEALANDEDWREFFAFIDSEAGPSMEEFGRATGNFVAGVANMVEALSGLSGGVSGDLLESSRAFREWAAGMEDTEGFQEFADYIRTNGPAVGDFLSSTADALVALATAVAPWGQVVLPILTAAADAFAALASSPIGPPLLTAAAALLAVSKASALLGPSLTRANAALGTTRTSIVGFGRDVKAMSTEFGNLGRAQSTALSFMSGTTGAAQRTRAALAGVAEGAKTAGPAMAAMGLMATGTADKMGLSNTAMLTLAGSMAGPWGSAAGAAVGLTMDLTHATDDLQAAVKGANDAMDSGNLTAMSAAVKQLNAQLKETTDNDVLGFDLGALDQLGAITNTIAPLSNVTKLMGGLTGETDKAARALAQIKDEKAGLEDLAVALGANRDSAAEMASGADRAQVAMRALGISNQDLAAAQRMGSVEFDLLTGRIQGWIASSESAAGRQAALSDAIANLGNDAISTADSASQLNAALQALFAPTLNLEAATDQWRASLKALREDLNVDAGFSSFTEAGRKNNELTRSYVNDSLERLTALADVSTTTEGDMARAVAKTREEFIKSGMAAGFSRKEITARADALGLTPELVETIFRELGIDEVDLKARGLKRQFDALPKEVRTDIQQNGIPKSEADITRLTKKYNLTPKQVRTLATLMNNASGPIGQILRELLNLDGRTATTTVIHRTINEIITISRGQSTRPDRRVEPGQFNADGGFYANGTRAFADGGYGSNGRYYSRTAQIIPGGASILWGEKETGWEAYISGKPSERDRNLQVLSMAADRLGAAVTPFANGGMAGRDPVAAALWQSGHRDPNAALIAGLTVRQLSRLGRAFDDLSGRRLSRLGRAVERAADLQEKQTERARDRFEKVRDRRSELGSSITDGLRGDLWSDTGGSAFGKQFASGSIGAVNAQLRSERDQAKQFAKDIALLRKKGLNGAALEEIIATGDADRARMFASGSVSALRSYEAAYNARQSATAAAGRLGGAALTPEYSALKAQLDRQVAEQQATNRQLTALRKEQKQQHDASQKSRDKNGAGPAAAKGARGRR